MIIKPTTNLLTPENAKALAAKLNADPEDDWTYEVVNGDGKSGPFARVLIRDEDGEELGYL